MHMIMAYGYYKLFYGVREQQYVSHCESYIQSVIRPPGRFLLEIPLITNKHIPGGNARKQQAMETMANSMPYVD